VEEIRSLTRISRDVGQSAAQLGKECDAGRVDGTEGLRSQWLKMWELGRDEYFADFLAAACSAAPPGLAQIIIFIIFFTLIIIIITIIILFLKPGQSLECCKN